MVLTNDGALQHKISHPDNKMSKTYWVQVEGACSEKDLGAYQTRSGAQRWNDTARLMRARHRRLRHLAAQPAHPSSQIDSRYLVNANPTGRQKPPSQTHVRAFGLSRVAADPLSRRVMDLGRP